MSGRSGLCCPRTMLSRLRRNPSFPGKRARWVESLQPLLWSRTASRAALPSTTSTTPTALPPTGRATRQVAREKCSDQRIDQSKSEQLHQHMLASRPRRVIGADGVATGFGNTPNGILRDPDQAVVDLSLSKNQKVPWPREGASVQLRADFFNALNHPNFAAPDNAYTTTPSAFGTITSMSTNPRVIQLALRFAF